jgi:hypothetical protein
LNLTPPSVNSTLAFCREGLQLTARSETGRASSGRFLLLVCFMPEDRTRRFPPPWTVEQIAGGYKVKDANGQSLTYVYGRETQADADIAHVLTMDEARRIASNIAKLPREASAQLGELFHKPHVSACISIF